MNVMFIRALRLTAYGICFPVIIAAGMVGVLVVILLLLFWVIFHQPVYYIKHGKFHNVSDDPSTIGTDDFFRRLTDGHDKIFTKTIPNWFLGTKK